MSTSHFWNHYIFTKIIEHSFSKKFEIQKQCDKDIQEKQEIYNKLNHKTNKERLSLFVQNIEFFPQKKKYLIFSTSLSNFQEIHLNFWLINLFYFTRH